MLGEIWSSHQGAQLLCRHISRCPVFFSSLVATVALHRSFSFGVPLLICSIFLLWHRNPEMNPSQPTSVRSTVARKPSATSTTTPHHRRTLSERVQPTRTPLVRRNSTATKSTVSKTTSTKESTLKTQTKATSALTRYFMLSWIRFCFMLVYSNQPTKLLFSNGNLVSFQVTS